MISAADKYERRKARYNRHEKKRKKYSVIIGYLRLIVFLTGLIISVLLYRYRSYYLCISAALCTMILFSYVVYLHRLISRNLKYSRELGRINEQSLKRLSGEWKEFDDCGEEFIDSEHDYSFDLDIFGRSSLFQWINTANTFLGRQKLKDILTKKPISSEDIIRKQIAIKELSEKLRWRQRLEAEVSILDKKMENPSQIIRWLEDKNEAILSPATVWFTRIFPVITVLSGVLFLLGIIPYQISLVLIFIQVIFLRAVKSKIKDTLSLAERFAKDIGAYKNMLKCIEKQNFSSEYLLVLKNKLYNKEKINASEQIKKFSKIADAVSSRYNAFYAILNVILMLDYWYAVELEKWKIGCGDGFKHWLQVIGEIESLASLAVIGHDNPQWAVPTIEQDNPKVIARSMGHPLLGENRICNHISIQEPNTTILITGSNMSGKSTFLRTVGINLLLAYTGAPVCAQDFSCAIMSIYTCMRVSDNLEKSISSFYAELLKIKNIVEASEDGEQIFFLLDEIFKGTNSMDRHTGASILIKQLSKSGNLGMVSTHDLELGALEQEKEAKVKNYHFEELYKDNKIYFDYKLKAGVSNTRNAVFLMKLAGIEIENNSI